MSRQKVHELFMRFQVERNLSPREIGKLSDARWACSYRNVVVIKERFAVVVDVLYDVQINVLASSDADIRVQAKGLVHQLLNFQFIAHLCLFCRILSETYVVSTTLQSSTIDISQSVKLITSMISLISDNIRKTVRVY